MIAKVREAKSRCMACYDNRQSLENTAARLLETLPELWAAIDALEERK